jgi:hypothetical protein
VFRVSYRVEAAGVVSLVAVPLILAAATWALVEISPWLAVGVGAALVIGLQAAVAKLATPTCTAELVLGFGIRGQIRRGRPDEDPVRAG